MPAEQFANNAQTTLNGAINNFTTSVVVNSVTGFPTTGQFRILIDSEILLVTSVNAGTNTFTVQLRGLSGTPDATLPAAHTNGATITQVLTAGAILNLPPFGASGPGHAVGYVPDPGSTTGTTRFLREDGTWVAPAVVPTGTILAYGGYSAPSGYLLCDGSPYLQSTYPALFSALSLSITGTVINGTNTITSVSPTASSDWIGATVIGNGIPNGTTITAIVTGPALQLSNNATATATGESLTLVPYGAADSTHFYVPDLRGRVPVGADPSQVNTPHLSGIPPENILYVGVSGGADVHSLVSNEMPTHNHTINDSGHTHSLPSACATLGSGTTGWSAVGATNYISAFSTTSGNSVTSITINNAGGGGAHNNMQPWQGVNYIIKT